MHVLFGPVDYLVLRHNSQMVERAAHEEINTLQEERELLALEKEQVSAQALAETTVCDFIFT